MKGTGKAMSVGLLLVIVGLMTTLLVQPIGVTATESHGENEDFVCEAILRQQHAIVYADMLMDSFLLGRMNEAIYPDYFGGLFFNDDGVLVINIVENHRSRLVSPTIDEAIKNDFVETRYVNHSYNDKNAILTFIRDYIETNPECPVVARITTTYMRATTNTVYVNFDFHYYNDESIALFRSTVLDSPIITFGVSGSIVSWLGDICEIEVKSSFLN